MDLNSKDKFINILVIFLIAFVLRFTFTAFFVGINVPPEKEPEPDAPQYEELAMNVIEKGEFVQILDGMVYHAYRSPLWPLCIGGIYKIFGKSRLTVRLFSILISSLVPVLIFLMALKLLNYKTAIISAIYTCFYPFYLFYSGLYLTESLFITLFYSSLLIIIYMIKEPNLKNSSLAAICLALTSLARPVTYPVPLFILIGLIINHGINKKTIKYFSIFTIIFIIFVSPWFIRNYKLFNKFLPGDSHGGMTFYGAYNPGLLDNKEMIGSWFMPEQKDIPESYRYNYRSDSELEQNRKFFNLGKKFIKEYPEWLPYFVYRRFIRFFNFWPNGSLFRKITSFVSYGFLIPFFIFGIFSLIKDKRTDFVIIYLIILEILLISLLIVASVRMRNPLDGFFIIFAVHGFFEIYSKFKIKNTKAELSHE